MNKERTFIVLITGALAGIVWFIEALIDYIFFYEYRFRDLLWFDIPPHEIYIRLSVIGLIMVGAPLLARYIARSRAAALKLAGTQKYYREILLHSSDVLYRYSVTRDVFEYISPSVSRLFGYTVDEIKASGRDGLLELIHPDDRDHLRRHIGRLITSRDKSLTAAMVELRVRKKDGTSCWVGDNQFINRDDDGRAEFIIGNLRDITARRKYEEEIQESRRRLETLLGNLPGMAYRCRNDNHWTMEFISDGCRELTGYKPSDLIANARIRYSDLIHPDDRQVVWDYVQAKLANKMSFQVTYRITDAAGAVRWFWEQGCGIFNADGDLEALEGFITDVTRQTGAFDALKNSEERFRTLFETATDAIFIKNRELRYVMVNPAMEKIFGHTGEDMIGKSFEDLFGHSMSEDINRVDRRVLDGDIVDVEETLPIRSENRILSVIKVPMRGSDGDIIGLCGIARDITETRRMQAFTERAQRLETAGRIAGQVAHDFNNLLGPLMAYPELIRSGLPPDSPIVKYANDIERAAEQIADINQQLLTLGRRGHYNQDPLNLNDAVRQILAQMHPIPESLTVTTDLADNLLAIRGGQAQLIRIIVNLINNARDAMQDIGHLTITSENYYAETRSGKCGAIPGGEYVRLAIADTGHGMDEKTMARIFDPFYTTKATDRRRGSGLGLSVVHAVVEDHHGYLDLDSHLGDGTTFYIYFPITRENIETKRPDQVVGGTESILVIDDDPLQREVCLRLLDQLGYDSRAVDSGEAAIELCGCENFDLVILDMIMPTGLDGTDTFRHLRQNCPEQKAILASGFAQSERVEEALALGAGSFIRKPLTLRSLAAAVRAELDRVPTAHTVSM